MADCATFRNALLSKPPFETNDGLCCVTLPYYSTTWSSHYIFLGHFLCDPGLLSHYKSSFCAAKTAKNLDNACSVLFWRKAVKIILKMTIEWCTVPPGIWRLNPAGGGDSAYEKGEDARSDRSGRSSSFFWPLKEIILKHRQYKYFYIFSRATLNETFTGKYDGVLPRTP